MAEATLKQVIDFFLGEKKVAGALKDFTGEWSNLTADDKDQIKAGIGDGSLSY